MLVVGVALAGLFTASVASILIERSLRSREVSNLEMSDHLVLCNWSPRALDWIREVHSGIVIDKRPVVIVHDTPDEVVLPDKQDEAAFNDVYIVKGDPANEVILRRAKVAQAHSVVILADDRQDQHADGKTIVCCIAVKNVCDAGAPAEHRGRVPGPEIPLAHAQGGRRRGHLGRRLRVAADGARLALSRHDARVSGAALGPARRQRDVPGAGACQLVGMDFVAAANVFLPDRTSMKACLLIGLYRGDTMMLNPVGGEAGPLHEGGPADPAEPESAGSVSAAAAQGLIASASAASPRARRSRPAGLLRSKRLQDIDT